MAHEAKIHFYSQRMYDHVIMACHQNHNCCPNLVRLSSRSYQGAIIYHIRSSIYEFAAQTLPEAISELTQVFIISS